MINYDLICGLGWLIPDWGSPESEFGGGGGANSRVMRW